MYKRSEARMLVAAFMFLIMALVGYKMVTPAYAQTATPTNTRTPTATPTPTNTPVATPLPLLSGVSSYVYSARCGSYGATVTGSDCFQALAGGIAVYNSAGARVWSVGSSGLQGGAGSVITVTDGLTLTPTSSFQPLASSGTVTVSVMTTAGYNAGDRVTLAQTSNQSIVFVDGSGTLMLTGNITLGQYDTLSLIFDGTEWLETSTSNN